MYTINHSSTDEAEIGEIVSGQIGPYTLGDNTDASKSLRKLGKNLTDFPPTRNLKISERTIIGPGGTPFINLAGSFLNLRQNGEFIEGVKTTIVTGTCLFDKNSAYLLHDDGSKTYFCLPSSQIKNCGALVVSHKPTPYEIETITRLASVINNISTNLSEDSEIIIHVPKFEYYTYLFDAYSKDLISYSQLSEWILHVNKKHSVMEGFFKRQLNYSNLNIKIFNPFDSEAFLKCFHQHKQLGVLQNYFCGQHDSSLTSTLEDMINLGYALPLIQTETAQSILVDDYSEFRIFEKAKFLVPNKNLFAILTCPQIVANQQVSTDLYQIGFSSPEIYRTIFKVNYEQ